MIPPGNQLRAATRFTGSYSRLWPPCNRSGPRSNIRDQHGGPTNRRARRPATASQPTTAPVSQIRYAGGLGTRHGGRRARVERLAQQQRHRVTRVVRQRTVEGDVGQRAVAALPGAKGEQSLEGGDGACGFTDHPHTCPELHRSCQHGQLRHAFGTRRAGACFFSFNVCGSRLVRARGWHGPSGCELWAATSLTGRRRHLVR
jgi:hypothetical protein